MTFLEWRKFQFFDLKKNVDNGVIADLFKEANILVTTSGNNHMVFGDSTGQISLVSRTWNVRTFRAYEFSIDLAYQLRNSPLLVTIGQDEPNWVNPLIKVWDTSRFDKNGLPFCCRTTKAVTGNRPVHASALCVHDGLQIMCIGFADGTLILYRGDITRERGSKQKLLRDVSSKVTGLAFKSYAANVYLFLATESSVIVYNITHKDREQKFQLDNIGCISKCSILAESTIESHFMVARSDAIYCYTTDGRGPCYAYEGEKVLIEWFRSYLVIISRSNSSIINETNQNPGDSITVLDIHNKFIVFSATIPSIRAILSEWGAFYIIDNDNQLYHLDEKDLQSKLTLLFKKNLYDVAIRIAKSQKYDSDGLVDIFRQYGDHLCDKSDFVGAIDQYIKTIGKLEPSYIIRKFLDSQHIEKLTKYLEALHKQNQASEDHTTLLLNCYTKLNNTLGQSDCLKEFILEKEDSLKYNVDVAIKVCRQGSPAEALMLAKKHAKHDWYIKLQIEDHERYVEVLTYISSLSFEEAEHYMKKYGNILIKNAPAESTQFLKVLCTSYKRSNATTSDSIVGALDTNERSDPEEYIYLFLNNSERLVEFLEYLSREGYVLSTPVYDTLLEHYLHVWTTLEDSAKTRYSLKIVKFMQNPDIRYDKSQALVVCHMNSFSDGILYLYEEQKLYQQILRHHIAKNDTSAVLACCNRFGNQDPNLWIQALWFCVRNTNEAPSVDVLNDILGVIAKEKLQSPNLVVDTLATNSAKISLGHLRSYLVQELKQEEDSTRKLSELTENYRKDTEILKNKLEEMKNGSFVIQRARCAACQHPLELPTVHFLCSHSYHQHCFQSFADEEGDCPACQPDNKDLVELLRARENNKDIHENFHEQLGKADDGFSVAAEYIGRGVFNQYRAIKEMIKTNLPIEPKRALAEEGNEERLRQVERKNSQVSIPIEGRQERKSYASFSEGVSKSFDPFRAESSNPFGDEDEDDEFDEKNPFSKSYGKQCDTNLNPFD